MPRSHVAGGQPPALEVLIESELWNAHPEASAVIRDALTQAEALSKEQGGIAILLTDDSSIQRLNRQWRQQDKATNVLSFPSVEQQAGSSNPRHLGDIAIAYETVVREAESEGKAFMHHLAHLAIHGYLHLLGYGHESHLDAEVMESLERDILARLSIPDPYAQRDGV